MSNQHDDLFQKDLFAIVVDAVATHIGMRDDSLFPVETQRCGRLRLRKMLTKVLDWLRYAGRGGRETDALRISGSGPLEAVSCVLGCSGRLTQLFEIQDGVVRWRSGVQGATRVRIIEYVVKN